MPLHPRLESEGKIMKKLLIGCGVLAILLFCLVVGTGVWLYFKAKRYADELKAIQTSYVATNSTYPFTSPDPAILDARRVGDFLIVRAALATRPDARRRPRSQTHVPRRISLALENDYRNRPCRCRGG